MNEDQSWDYQEQDEEEASPLSDKKKNALVRYMAILFGVAFLLVLLSFLIQLRDSRETISDLSHANSSALQNAGRLQEDNEKLSQDKENLERRIAELQTQLQATENSAKQAEAARKDTLNELAAVQKTLAEQTRANGHLLEAVQDWMNGEREKCAANLDKLELTELDEAGQALYSQLRRALSADTAENAEQGETGEEI